VLACYFLGPLFADWVPGCYVRCGCIGSPVFSFPVDGGRGGDSVHLFFVVCRPLERPRLRWVDNIRMDLQEVGCGYMDWIGLAQDRDRWRTLVSTVMNLRVP